MAKKRLGELLLELKAKTPAAMPTLTPEVIEQALATQAAGGRAARRDPGQDARHHRGGGAAGARASSWGSPTAPTSKADDVDIDLATSIPIGFAKQHRLLAVKREGDVGDGGDGRSAGHRARSTICACSCRLEVQPVLVPSQRILEVINDVYGRKARQGRRPRQEGGRGGRGRRARSWSTSWRSPTRRRSSAGSTRCCSTRSRSGPATSTSSRARRRSWSATASTACSTRRGSAARQFMPSIISRVKIMAGLNIAEKRLPQDGRIRRKIAGKDIDMRVATVADGQAGRAHHHPSARPRIGAARSGRHRLRRRSPAADGRADPQARTASCWSPGRPARARRRRSTPAWRRSTRPISTS